jgi:transposase
LDVAKSRRAVAVAEKGSTGRPQILGEIDGDPVAVRRMVTRLAKRRGRLHFYYKTGPTDMGYTGS